MNAVACKGVEVRCAAGNEGFTFTCSHLGDSALMKNDGTDYLHGEGLFAQNSPCALSYGRKSLGEDIVKSFAVFKSFLELRCLGFQLSLGELAVFFVQIKHLLLDRVDLFQFSFTVVSEKSV